MDCSFCTQYAELYNFQPAILDGTMPGQANASSSEEEVVRVSAISETLSPPALTSTSTPAADQDNNKNGDGATDSGAEKTPDADIHRMVKQILDAVRNSPTDNPAKGVSIHKIKKYLKMQYNVLKAQMTQQLKPALELALRRKLLLKVTGRNSVLVGSVKLNPANESSTTSDSSSSEEEQVKKPAPMPAKVGRKRRNGVDEALNGDIKRLKA